MYGLNAEVDLSFLKERKLIQLCIGLFQVIFKFDEDVAISVEGEFRYFDGQNEHIWRHEPDSFLVAAHTVTLLGASIEHFEGNSNGTLNVTFSNHHRLTIVDSSKEYESYDITRPGQTIVV